MNIARLHTYKKSQIFMSRRPLSFSTTAGRTQPLIHRPPTTSKQGMARTQPLKRPPNSARIAKPWAPEPLLDDPECISMRDQLYENEDFSEFTNDQLSRVYGHLRELTTQHAIDEQYTEARRSNALMENVRKELIARNLDGFAARSRAEMSPEELFERHWQNVFDRYDRETEEKRSQMETKNARVLETFERTWTDEMPSKYRKPSARFLELKSKEKRAALAKDFDTAEKFHRECEALMQKEAAAAQAALITDYHDAKARLLERQSHEMENFENQRIQGRVLIEADYKRAKRNAELREFVVKDREAMLGKRTRYFDYHPELASSLEAGVMSRKRCVNVLLPPLTPPNDPALVQTQERTREDKKRRSMHYSRWNAERTLSKYNGVDAPPPPEEIKQPSKPRTGESPRPKRRQIPEEEELSESQDATL